MSLRESSRKLLFFLPLAPIASEWTDERPTLEPAQESGGTVESWGLE